MHEFALAEGVVASAIAAAEKAGMTRIQQVEVRIGELQRISRETFEFALTELLPADEPRIAGASFELAVEPARFRCRPCEHEFKLADTAGPADHDQREAIHFIPELAHGFLCCPACRSPDFEVLEGRGVVLAAVEGE